jgi:hypothetical protein
MNQHYLPVFYLKHFTDPATPAGQDPYVWVFQNHQWRNKAPRKVACARNFYAFEQSDGSVNHLFENKLQELESLMAPALTAISQRKPRSITGGERVFLSYLLVSMQQRTPGYLNAWADELERFIKWQYRMLFNSFNNEEEKFEKFKASFSGDNSDRFASIDMNDVSPENFEQWTVRPVTAFTLSQLMKSWEFLASVIFSMNWTMLYADAPVFVTSEAPVVSIAPLPDGSWENCDFRTPTVDVSFPLTPTRALLCSWRGSDSYSLVKASDQDVKTLNLRTINSAADVGTVDSPAIEVVAASRDFPFADVVARVSAERQKRTSEVLNVNIE